MTRDEDLALFNWRKATPEERCEQYRKLDRFFRTDSNSPLHHDNRCELHKVKGTY